MLSHDNNEFEVNAVYEAKILPFENGYSQPAFTRRAYQVSKRGMDIVLSTLALVALSPIMLLIALIIWLDDPHGSPIYVSKRCGKDGKQFNFYKFRSMYVDAETQQPKLLKYNEADGPVFKIRNDPRITRVGKFIRRINLDELPQLFNILRGHMSIVGPRPPIPREVEQYTEYQMKRLSVIPGLTCYWQVQPSRNELSFNEWVDLDIRYIYECNLWLDIKLIARTFETIIKGEGQ